MKHQWANDCDGCHMSEVKEVDKDLQGWGKHPGVNLHGDGIGISIVVVRVIKLEKDNGLAVVVVSIVPGIQLPNDNRQGQDQVNHQQTHEGSVAAV